MSNGSPRHGHVADIMRRTRAKYDYVIRRIKNKVNYEKIEQWQEQ